MVALLVDLGLFGAYEGALVNVGVYLDVRVVAELQGILEERVLACLSACCWLPGTDGESIA